MNFDWDKFLYSKYDELFEFLGEFVLCWKDFEVLDFPNFIVIGWTIEEPGRERDVRVGCFQILISENSRLKNGRDISNSYQKLLSTKVKNNVYKFISEECLKSDILNSYRYLSLKCAMQLLSNS